MTAPRPYTLVAELTYRCPLRCPYCSNPINLQLMQTELSTEQWQRVFSEAADLGVVQVHLSGGEPVVRKDLPALIRHARQCDLYTNLITGGTLLTEERLQEFRDNGLDHVQLSVQDTDRDTAELIAGVRSYDKKLEVARSHQEAGIAADVQCCRPSLQHRACSRTDRPRRGTGRAATRTRQQPVLFLGSGKSQRVVTNASSA